MRIDEAITEVEKYLNNYDVNKDTEYLEDDAGYEIKGSRAKLALLRSIVPSNLTPA